MTAAGARSEVNEFVFLSAVYDPSRLGSRLELPPSGAHQTARATDRKSLTSMSAVRSGPPGGVRAFMLYYDI